MAVAAEFLETEPHVLVVPEMGEDLLARQQAERLIQYAGTLALASSVERPYAERQPPSRFPTLMHAIHEAISGTTNT